MRCLRPLAALTVLAWAGASLAAQAPRVPTHQDIFLLKRVGAPAVSPDGKWAAFSVTEPAYDPKEQRSDIWLKALGSGAPPRQITFTKASEGGLAWAPDGRRLAFTAKREGDEQSQIYVLDLAGGEARRVTELPLGAKAPKWSPDGTKLLFVSEVYPGAEDVAAIAKEAKARKDRKGTARTYDAFPVRRWDHWMDDRKPSLWVQAVTPGAAPKNLLAGSKALADRGFNGTQGNEGASLDAVWTPDGGAVVFVAVPHLNESARSEVDSHLFHVSAQGGEPVQLTTGHADHGQPAFAPDGKTLLCVRTPNDGKVYHVGRLTAFPWPFQDKPAVLTAALDRAIARFVVPVGSNRVYFTYEHAGLEKLYSMPLTGGEIREEPGPARGCVGALVTGGGKLFGTWDSAAHPPEVCAFTERGAEPFTHFTDDAVKGLAWAPLEHFWTTKGGRRLHSMLVKPHLLPEGKKVPLFVVIHGGAASMWKDSFSIRWNYDLLTQPGQAVLLTDYRGSSGYGEAFGQSIFLDPLKGPADDVNAAADDALARFPFLDATRQAAGGASYGGHLANWLQATTTRYKAIISHAGEMDLALQWGTSDGIYHRELTHGGPVWEGSKLWREQSPLMQGGNHAKGTGFKTPILITVGELDYRVPLPNALMNFAMQQRLQVPSRLVVFPDENHWILKGENHLQWYEEVKAWLAKYL